VTATARRLAVARADAEEADDQALVARFVAGDQAAFDALVRRYQRPIYWLARRYVGSDADAKDVTQRALLQAFLRLGGLRDQESFRAWLYKVAVNLALNVVRDRKPEVAVEGEPVAADTEATAGGPAARLIEDEAQRRLRAAVAELPPQQRLVVELRVFDELPFREVAAVAECSEESARVNFHHALKRLRQRMNGDEG
jgi:RNA polymerase sigma-70 factor (ECF subfamily)